MDMDTISTLFIIIIGIYILGVLASMSSGTAREVAISEINALDFAVVLILAIPSTKLILFIISQIIKSSRGVNL